MDGVLLVIRGEVTFKAATVFEGKQSLKIEVSSRYGFKKFAVEQDAFNACPEVGQRAVLTCTVGRLQKGKFGDELTGCKFHSVAADKAANLGPAEGSARSTLGDPPMRRAA